MKLNCVHQIENYDCAHKCVLHDNFERFLERKCIRFVMMHSQMASSEMFHDTKNQVWLSAHQSIKTFRLFRHQQAVATAATKCKHIDCKWPFAQCLFRCLPIDS